MRLPDAFLTAPIAHRGLHRPGVPENSLAAAQAAIDAGYGIELDIQPAGDQAVVFHDYDLRRLTGTEGFIAALEPAALAGRRLLGTDHPIPTLQQFLDLVGGRVPLLVEIKDQDMRLGPRIGDLHRRVADALRGYDGPVAVMSFNPHVVEAFHRIAPDIPVGLTTCSFPEKDWSAVPPERRSHLAAIADFDRSGACFVSHDKNDLKHPRIDALKAQGVPILCWTVRSPDEEISARRVADNITFEAYRAAS
ncbi:phosphodiesterase [Paracoccus sediminis]|uniref:Phosphodiesterase n=1 Tax=Paracoccus sediminis TaxID=1214787 RepID=A0A238VWB9_9RHOB|nr:glycerophosphodiester phosphodiesterase family protein [Paracoccus sediminis]TBN51353.1 phosphodiesterase [Paracoccus sediminis]SNR38538.1 Glycerophosphoryl diester phosphodiesterase [Paracoccus sediminis]